MLRVLHEQVQRGGGECSTSPPTHTPDALRLLEKDAWLLEKGRAPTRHRPRPSYSSKTETLPLLSRGEGKGPNLHTKLRF